MGIMVPLDMSELSASALPLATRLAQALGQGLLLVAVVNPAVRSPLEDFAAAEGEHPFEIVDGKLRDAARSLSGVQVATETLSGSDPASSIIERAGVGDIEMIVLASHGRSGVQRWMLGSVAERVVRGATVPVTVVPAPWRTVQGPGPMSAVVDR